MVLVGGSPQRGADLAIGAESKWHPAASRSQNEAASRDPAQRFNIPKTQPERVQLLAYNTHADEAARLGRGGVEGDCWAKFSTRLELGKKMFSWGERRGTLLAEEMERTELDGLHKAWVLKKPLNPCSTDEADDADTVMRQAVARMWADRFNSEEGGHLPVRFLDMCLADMQQRKGAPRARLEEIVDGAYDRVQVRECGGGEALVVARFEAFVYRASLGQLVITHIAKVGDLLWTQPTMHSLSGKLGGSTDQGWSGIARWLAAASPLPPPNPHDERSPLKSPDFSNAGRSVPSSTPFQQPAPGSFIQTNPPPAPLSNEAEPFLAALKLLASPTPGVTPGGSKKTSPDSLHRGSHEGSVTPPLEGSWSAQKRTPPQPAVRHSLSGEGPAMVSLSGGGVVKDHPAMVSVVGQLASQRHHQSSPQWSAITKTHSGSTHSLPVVLSHSCIQPSL
ncbi:hypothetical protein T484DRAFT_1910759, partial [Baffinella frigidus]